HDPGLSSLEVVVDPSGVVVVLSLAAADADRVGGANAIAALARDSIAVRGDGRRLEAPVASARDDSQGVHVRLAYGGRPGSSVLVSSVVPQRLGRGHRQLASIRTKDGTVLAERMLDARSTELDTRVGESSGNWRTHAGRFLTLGVRHILTGYDHLLF